MNGVYKSLKVRVQDTLQRGKTNSTPLLRVKSGSALSLNDEMEELERIVADRIGRLKSAVKEGEAMVVDEAQQAKELVESLKASNAVLEAKLTETKAAVQTNDSSRQQIEESLTAKIQDLQNEVKKKEETLASLGNQINDLKSGLDVQLKQKGDLESAIEKATQEAAIHAKRAEHVAESSRIKIATLESQLREKEELGRQNESTINALEQKLNAKIQDFESLARDKEEQLAGRDAEINDLKSWLKLLTKGIGQMSSFFRQAEALAGIEGQDVSAAALKEPVDGRQEKPVTVQSNVSEVVPIVPEAAREIVSPDIFGCITGEFAEVTGVMSPLSLLIVRQHVAALGESMEKFPKTRLAELLERLVTEISDEKRQVDFRARVARNAQIGGGSGVLS
jgi:chromosome segregation ATPase